VAILACCLLAACSASQPTHRRSAKVAKQAGDDRAPIPKGFFAWPADGSVSSRFGPRGNSNHDGIDISAPEGTPVRAAADGVVIYCDVLRGYGNVVIVDHKDGLSSVYAHNKLNLARVGARVRRGDVIASMGQTGKTTGPNLHFEIRRHNVARDPIRYLPQGSPSLIAQRTQHVGG
jgi:murein DD-endopeptidase MepM/ murein hydrolase activator NlpD